MNDTAILNTLIVSMAVVMLVANQTESIFAGIILCFGILVWSVK